MEKDRLLQMLSEKAPDQANSICKLLALLTDELDAAKSKFTQETVFAQVHEKYDVAREYIEAQESLSSLITAIQHNTKLFMQAPAIEEEGQNGQNGYKSNSSENAVNESGRTAIDYEQYDVDNTIAYNLEETTVTFKRPAAFALLGKLYHVTTWKEMLVKQCEVLYKRDPTIIKSMVNEKRRSGSRRLKLDTTAAKLAKPRKIAGSNIYIETNRSADDIRAWMLELLKRYNIPTESVKIYLRRDLSDLHKEGASNEEMTFVNNSLPPLPDLSMKVGKFVRTAMESLANSGYVFSEEMMEKLCSPSAMNEEMGMSRNMPFFKKWEPGNPTGYIVGGRNRYYTQPLKFGEHTVYMSSQLYEGDKEPFVKWYLRLPASQE